MIIIFFFLDKETSRIKMAADEKQLADMLRQLKTGITLIKHKPNGKKYYRRFYLHDREGSITYEGSRKVFGKPTVCK